MGGQHFVGTGHLAGTDGPHGLISHGKAAFQRVFPGGQAAVQLTAQHVFQLAGFALFQLFSDAEHDLEALLQGKGRLAAHQLIGFAQHMTALGMPGQHPDRTGVLQHARRDLAGERPFHSRPHVLRTGLRLRSGKGIRHVGDGREGREHHDLVRGRLFVQGSSHGSGRFAGRVLYIFQLAAMIFCMEISSLSVLRCQITLVDQGILAGVRIIAGPFAHPDEAAFLI